MARHTIETYAALLGQEWILGLDATVKTLYGPQVEACVGYNQTKPGRPSQVYQAMLCSAEKLVPDVDVQAGNRTASAPAQLAVWRWLKSRPRSEWPPPLREDIAHGNEEMMAGAEKQGLASVFTPRQTKGVLRHPSSNPRAGSLCWPVFAFAHTARPSIPTIINSSSRKIEKLYAHSKGLIRKPSPNPLPTPATLKTGKASAARKMRPAGAFCFLSVHLRRPTS